MADAMEISRRLEEALLAVDAVTARALVESARGEATPWQVLEQVITPALVRIGTRWEEGRAALSQVYMSGRICEDLMLVLIPPSAAPRGGPPRIAVAVLDDYHFLGKNMVCSALRVGGYDFLDYGHVGVEDLVLRVCTDGIEALLISTLMLPSALHIKEVRAQLRARGRAVKIVVGGAPFGFDPALWREVGADAMGHNALEVLEILPRLGFPAGREGPP